MYAVIRSGGKQYRVEPGAVVRVESLPGKVGAKITFKEVLAVNDDGGLKVGAPSLAKAKVTGTIVAQDKHKKVRVLKFKKNSQYKILRGHRQRYTAVKVNEISA
ncbi:MAG: 50S ribosomal protein L21 [Terriglobia bacterium]